MNELNRTSRKSDRPAGRKPLAAGCTIGSALYSNNVASCEALKPIFLHCNIERRPSRAQRPSRPRRNMFLSRQVDLSIPLLLRPARRRSTALAMGLNRACDRRNPPDRLVKPPDGSTNPHLKRPQTRRNRTPERTSTPFLGIPLWRRVFCALKPARR